MPAPTPTSITLLSSPYHNGNPSVGPARGPPFLLSPRFRLFTRLESHNFPIHTITIPSVSPADFDGDIARSFEVLRRTARLIREVRAAGSFPILLAGNCTASVGVAAGLSDPNNDDGIGIVWLDAHDDFNTPDTLVSGYLDSMPLAMLAGECWTAILDTVPGHRALRPVRNRLVCVGMRDVTEVERARVLERGIDVVWGSDGSGEKVDFASGLEAMLRRKEIRKTMVHVDLDCLDVSLGKVNKFSAPGGLLEKDLRACLDAAVALTEPVALTIASFDPSCDPVGAKRVAEVAVGAIEMFVAGLVAKGVVAPQPTT